MAINEKLVTGRKFRRLLDKESKLWQLISWWTKASDVEFDDGKTAEQKLGNINGITSIFSNRDDIAASISSVSAVNRELQYRIGGFRIYRGDDGYIYIVDESAGADSVPKKLGDGDPETFDTYDSVSNFFIFTEDMSHAYVHVIIQQSTTDKTGLKIQLPDQNPKTFGIDEKNFYDEQSGFSCECITHTYVTLPSNDPEQQFSNSMFHTFLYLFKDIPAGTMILQSNGIIVFN